MGQQRDHLMASTKETTMDFDSDGAMAESWETVVV